MKFIPELIAMMSVIYEIVLNVFCHSLTDRCLGRGQEGFGE